MSIISSLSESIDALYEPSALNSSGQIVGGGRFSSLEIGGSAFIVAAGNATFFSLPQESYSGFPDTSAFAYAINDAGVVVGDTYSNTYPIATPTRR